MSIGQTKRIRRGVMAALRPLTGDRASGTVLVSATGDDIVLPRGSVCLPVVVSTSGSSQIADDRPLFVTADTTVTAAGVSVPVASLLGGARHNLPVGTTVRWDPELIGVETQSTVDAALAGGADASGPGAARAILAFETLGPDAAKDLFAARVAHTPAIVIAWESSGPSESTQGGRARRADQWLLYVVTATRSSAVVRGEEGLELLDAVESYLTDRAAADGIPFSSPPAQILGRIRVTATPTSFIYGVRLATHCAVERIDGRALGTDYAEWLKTKLNATTAAPSPLPVVVDATYDHA